MTTQEVFEQIKADVTEDQIKKEFSDPNKIAFEAFHVPEFDTWVVTTAHCQVEKDTVTEALNECLQHEVANKIYPNRKI